VTNPIRILCVDDERNVLRALERLFLDEDYEIISACSGEEGLLILEREENIQIVISDYRMPGMTGVEFLREVCRRRPETLRIVLSGYANTAAVVEAINEGGIYKFIPKPWDDDELKSTIQRGLEKYAQRRQDSLLLAELRKSKEILEAEVAARAAQLVIQDQALSVSRNLQAISPVDCRKPARKIDVCTEGRALCGEGHAHLSETCWKAALPAAVRALGNNLGGHCRVFHTIASLGQELQVSSAQVNFTGQEGFILINFEKRG
jgi:response regulator RpfG family c-di-GMP phosphodiesterase